MHVSINAQYKVSFPYLHVQIPLDGKELNRSYGAAYDFHLGDSAVLTDLGNKPTDVSSLATGKPYASCKLNVYSDAVCVVKDGVTAKMPEDKGQMVAAELIAHLGLKVTAYAAKPTGKAPAKGKSAKAGKAPAKKSTTKKASPKLPGFVQKPAKSSPKKAAKSTAKKPVSKKAPAKGGKK